MSEPQDLGVPTSAAEFDAVLAKIGVVWPELPAGADRVDYERVYSGEQPMDVTLTESELAALMSYRHDPSQNPSRASRSTSPAGTPPGCRPW